MKRGLYAGSFDPITRGHTDIIRQALSSNLFDVLNIAVGVNPAKKRLFTPRESAELIRDALTEDGFDMDRIEVSTMHSSLMRHAEETSATAIIRGLRQISDFNDEFVLHGILQMTCDVPVMYLICRQDFLHVSSSSARQLAALGVERGLDKLVHPSIERALRVQLAINQA